AGRPLTPGVVGPGGGRRGPVHRETHNGVEIFRASGTALAPRRFVGRAANYVTYFLSASLAGFLVPRPDVVVALTDPPIIGLGALAAARRARARFVFMCQDIFPEGARLLEGFQSDTVERLLTRADPPPLPKAHPA